MKEGTHLNQSRLEMPGSEKYTRPEEIQSLSKYLKAIKETRDENLRLEDQLLAAPGRTTGKIPEIKKLDERQLKKIGRAHV